MISSLDSLYNGIVEFVVLFKRLTFLHAGFKFSVKKKSNFNYVQGVQKVAASFQASYLQKSIRYATLTTYFEFYLVPN